MTDKKPTDSEIIKALECCKNGDINKSHFELCAECPYYELADCTYQLKVDALDLINRQKAEIERLRIRLRKTEHQLDDATKMYNTIKAEAYKEFAELLCKIWQRYEDENISGIYVPEWVMLVYKELVGEDNEKT